MNGTIVVTFSPEEGAGSSHSCEGELCSGPTSEGLPCFIVSGVLNRIINSTRANVSYCYSTFVVTPGQLNNRTAELMACPRDNYQSLNVTCEVIGLSNISEITQTQEPHLFQIAGKSCVMNDGIAVASAIIIIHINFCVGVPSMPDSQSSSCYYYRSNSSVTVQIGMPSSINTDLDYYKVELFCDGTLLDTNLAKLSEIMGNIEDPTIMILFDNIMLRSTGIGSTGRCYVNLTLFDKCGQHSPQPLTITCDLKGKHPYI